jgi:hypothetical protein
METTSTRRWAFECTGCVFCKEILHRTRGYRRMQTLTPAYAPRLPRTTFVTTRFDPIQYSRESKPVLLVSSEIAAGNSTQRCSGSCQWIAHNCQNTYSQSAAIERQMTLRTPLLLVSRRQRSVKLVPFMDKAARIRSICGLARKRNTL